MYPGSAMLLFPAFLLAMTMSCQLLNQHGEGQ
jgi:hypothetical protein